MYFQNKPINPFLEKNFLMKIHLEYRYQALAGGSRRSSVTRSLDAGATAGGGGMLLGGSRFDSVDILSPGIRGGMSGIQRDARIPLPQEPRQARKGAAVLWTRDARGGAGWRIGRDNQPGAGSQPQWPGTYINVIL